MPSVYALRMIYLALTAGGLQQAIRSARAEDAIWCGSDAISEEAYAALEGVNLSRFNYALTDRSLVNGALLTIEEHHPGQVIWVESAA